MTTYLKGVEMPLPEGEHVLWQGSPDPRALALHAFHVRKIAIYFGSLMALAALFARGQQSPVSYFLTAAFWLALSGATAIGFALLVARLAATTTLYAITERRVVMKIGIALPVVLNVPLHVIERVAVQRFGNGQGSLALKLTGNARVAFLMLWPHARAWRLRHPEPLFRCVDDVEAVGVALRNALEGQGATAGQRDEPASEPAPEPDSQRSRAPAPSAAFAH